MSCFVEGACERCVMVVCGALTSLIVVQGVLVVLVLVEEYVMNDARW